MIAAVESCPGPSLQCQTNRHRHAPQLRPCEHHHRIVSDPGKLGEEFGVPGIAETGPIERILVDRIGHDCGRAASLHVGDRGLDRADYQLRVGRIGAARPGPNAAAHRTHGQCPREHRAGFRNSIERDNRDIPAEATRDRGQPPGIVDNIEWRNALSAAQPCLESQSRHRSRLARPLSGRVEAAAVSHPYVDIGLAPQVAKVPPRDRIQPLAYQRFGDVLARAAFPPDG